MKTLNFLKKSALKISLIFIVLLNSSCSTDNVDDVAPLKEINIEVPETKPIEVLIAKIINEHRISLGLNKLLLNDIVKYKAKEHNIYMIEKSQISHDNFGNRASFIKSYTNANRVSENVAYGYNSAQSVVNAWINSDSHYEAMIGDYTHFDISAEKHENGHWYFTNIFIKK